MEIATVEKQNLMGGLGGSAPGPLIQPPQTGLIDERTPGKDLKLIQAAIKKGWKIPDEVLEQLPTEMWEIAKDKLRDDRPRIAAAKVLLAMNAQANPPEASDRSVNVGVNVSVKDDLYD